MKKKHIFSVVVVISALLVIGILPMLSWNTSYSFDKWKDESGIYRSGTSSDPFYIGEKVVGTKFSCTLYEATGPYYDDCIDSYVNIVIKRGSDGPTLYSGSDYYGPIEYGETATFEFTFDITLTDSTDLWMDFVYHFRGSEEGWLTGQSGSKTCVVVAPSPHLSLESYALDKQVVYEGEFVTATFSIKNTGTEPASTFIALYSDVNNHDQFIYDVSESNVYYYESGVNINPGETVTKVKTFEAKSQDEQYNDPGKIHVRVYASASGSSDIHDEKVVEIVTGDALTISCQDSVREETDFQATVYQGTNPLQMATVTFNGNSYISDTYGKVYLTAPDVDEDTQYLLTVQATGYMSGSKYITVTDYIPVDNTVSLIVAIIASIVSLVVFGALSFFAYVPYKYILLVIGIALSGILFYAIYFMGVLGL